MISPIFISLRPKQWNQNLLIFIALLLSNKIVFFTGKAWLYSFAAFVIFCGLSSCVYLLNDIIDIAKDRNHPIKSRKPIAAGLVSLTEAKAVLLILLFISLFGAWKISEVFFAISLGYFMLNMAYYFKLKQIIIIDSLCIAISYVLKTLAGIEALKVINADSTLSSWLIISVFSLGMFSAFAKKRIKIATSENNRSQYTLEYLDQITSILATISIISYVNFTNNSENSYLIYTTIFMIYWILRYFFVIHMSDNDNNTILLSNDKPLIISEILWVLAVLFILYCHN